MDPSNLLFNIRNLYTKDLPDDLELLIKNEMKMPYNSNLFKGYHSSLPKIYHIQFYEKLIEKITKICSYKVINKETKKIKNYFLLDAFKEKIILIHGNDLYNMNITQRGHHKILSKTLFDLFSKYMTRQQSINYINYLLDKIDIKNPTIYNQLKIIYEKIHLDNIDLLKRSTYFMISDVKDISKPLYEQYLIDICNFLQYINDNIKQFDEKFITELIYLTIIKNIKLVCTNMINELKMSIIILKQYFKNRTIKNRLF